MADSAYTARQALKDSVLRQGRATISFPKDGYTYDDVENFKRGLTHVLSQQFNHGNKKGMAELLEPGKKAYKASSSYYTTATTVLAAAKRKAAQTNETLKNEGKAETAVPEFVERSDANDEADRLNAQNQATLGAKEAAIELVVEMVGTDVTDSILKEPFTNQPKPIDDVHLDKLLEAVLLGANRPPTTSIIDKLVGCLLTEWNFTHKCAVNIEHVRTAAAQLKAYGVTVDNTQLALNIMANVETAAKQPWGQDFVPTLRTLRRRYKYNYVHDDASIEDIATELAQVDSVRNVGDAAPIDIGFAKSVSDSFSALADLYHNPSGYETAEDSGDEGTAAAAGSDNEGENAAARGRGGRDGRRGRSASRRRGTPPPARRSPSANRESWKTNPCPHCKKFKRRSRHPNKDNNECFWNKKYKGWRPKWVCEEMEMKYVPRHKFDADSDDE
jgi:hypothetical protein